MKTNSLKKFYLALVIFSLTGQIAWVVENMYFNVFIYKMFNASAEQISLMVSASAVAATLTAIDMHKYSVFSMICYIGMGWAVIPFAKQAYTALTAPGFALLLWGGIAYSVGAVLYGIGGKKKWLHTVFHVFVVLGALLQFLSVLLYAL